MFLNTDEVALNSLNVIPNAPADFIQYDISCKLNVSGLVKELLSLFFEQKLEALLLSFYTMILLKTENVFI